jgi:hypothetical protein
MAARAAVNGAPTSATTASNATSSASGTPGSAMTSTSAQRNRSEAIITRRRGKRSARPASVTPPMNSGTTLTMNVTAASSAELVLS